MHPNRPFRPLRVLSLDGGGVRGLVSLLILKAIMKEIVNDGSDGGTVRPCEHFDLIGGTSAGGLIAIMLGRLGLTVEECISHFHSFSEYIFDTNALEVGGNFIRNTSRFSCYRLETAIQRITRASMLVDTHHCPAFVVAVDGTDLIAPPIILPTYHTEDTSAIAQCVSNFRAWEACRATSAAPTYFVPFYKDEYVFVDGGMGYNNPVLLAYQEAKKLTTSSIQIGCLVSIGTGTANKKKHSMAVAGNIFGTLLGIFGAMKAMVTDTEQADRQMRNKADRRQLDYFRFNPTKKKDISLHHWKKMGVLTRETEEYLRDENVRSDLGRCAQLLTSREFTSILQQQR